MCPVISFNVKNRYSTVSLAWATGHAVRGISAVAFNQAPRYDCLHATTIFFSLKETFSSGDPYVGFEDGTEVVMKLSVFWT
jgi:hypothetical protein